MNQKESDLLILLAKPNGKLKSRLLTCQEVPKIPYEEYRCYRFLDPEIILNRLIERNNSFSHIQSKHIKFLPSDNELLKSLKNVLIEPFAKMLTSILDLGIEGYKKINFPSEEWMDLVEEKTRLLLEEINVAEVSNYIDKSEGFLFKQLIELISGRVYKKDKRFDPEIYNTLRQLIYINLNRPNEPRQFFLSSMRSFDQVKRPSIIKDFSVRLDEKVLRKKRVKYCLRRVIVNDLSKFRHELIRIKTLTHVEASMIRNKDQIFHGINYLRRATNLRSIALYCENRMANFNINSLKSLRYMKRIEKLSLRMDFNKTNIEKLSPILNKLKSLKYLNFGATSIGRSNHFTGLINFLSKNESLSAIECSFPFLLGEFDSKNELKQFFKSLQNNKILSLNLVYSWTKGPLLFKEIFEGISSMNYLKVLKLSLVKCAFKASLFEVTVPKSLYEFELKSAISNNRLDSITKCLEEQNNLRVLTLDMPSLIGDQEAFFKIINTLPKLRRFTCHIPQISIPLLESLVNDSIQELDTYVMEFKYDYKSNPASENIERCKNLTTLCVRGKLNFLTEPVYKALVSFQRVKTIELFYIESPADDITDWRFFNKFPFLENLIIDGFDSKAKARQKICSFLSDVCIVFSV